MKVIAEIGSNWKTIGDCKESIQAAARCGADVVKFQFYTHREIYGASGKMKGEMPLEWLSHLYSVAQSEGIEFMCTAFSPSGYHYVNAMVETHKIASAELTALDIIDTVNGFRKPVILSTGGANMDDIEAAVNRLSNCPVTLMFCVADYPAKIIDFRQLVRIRNHFGGRCRYGYSDHSIDVLNIPLIAKAVGCEVIEKHVNFTPYTDTPDAGHALNESEFRLMVQNLKTPAGPSLEETEALCNVDMRMKWKRKQTPDGFFRSK